MKKYRENILVRSIAVAFGAIFLYTAFFGIFVPSVQRSVHLLFTMVLGFLLYTPFPGRGHKALYTVMDGALALLSLFIFGYFFLNQEILTNWIVFVSPFEAKDFAISIVATVLVVEVGRRATGYALPIVSLVFLLYGKFGNYLPGTLHHNGFSWQKLMEFTYYGFDGIFGLPMAVSATFIIIFITFGCFFELAGGGDAMMDLGKYLCGRYRGGPAKIAVVGSGLFGTISGSAVANVYATGTFSIPLMKKLGFRPSVAGAVEACASTGGQIAPPVMGAAAFVMAEFIGLPYAKIIAYAAIPAILYYFALFMHVDLEAGKTGLKGVPAEELPSGKQVRSHLPILFPIVVLIALLVRGYSAMMAGGYATLAIVIVSWFDKNRANAMTPTRILKALELSGRRTVTIAVACALSGIIIGVVQYTGLGMNFVGMVSSLSGTAWICPILVAVASIILGMGVPTTVAYIIVVAVSVPAMKHLGFGVLPSHMFAFYFAVISMITPPVAPASLAASELAGEKFFSVGWEACKMGFITFLIPFMFLYEPALLLQGSVGEILWVFASTSVAVVAVTIAIRGWWGIPATMVERFFFAGGGLMTMIPGYTNDLIGMALVMAAYMIHRKRKTALQKNPALQSA